jgi:hypothetical protein
LLDVDKSQNAETNIELTNTNTGSAAQVRTKYTTDGGLFTVGKTSNAHAYGGDAYIHNVDNTNIRFATNDTERARFDSNGHLILKKNLVLESTSEGIDFSGVGSSAQTLDSYEEGTWTPAFGFSSAPSGITYSGSTYGTYVKIGRKVLCNGRCQVTSLGTGGSGETKISGLPFTCSTPEGTGSIGFLRNISTSLYQSFLMLILDTSTTAAPWRYVNSSGGYSDVQYSELTNTTDIVFSFMYETVN